MSKVAKQIDLVLIEEMKEKIKDPNYISRAVSVIAEAISIQLFGERG